MLALREKQFSFTRGALGTRGAGKQVATSHQ
jgi:hypothetical protein